MLASPELRPLTPIIAAAGDSLARGEPVLVFDARDREAETDIFILSERATPELIRLLRRDAGGLLCTAISAELRQRLGLPYYAELLEDAGDRYPIARALLSERLAYDRRSAFGLSVNHRTNFTGVPDNDRAVTVARLGALARDAARLPGAALRERFAAEFTSPGHLSVLYSAPELLRERKGHTELAISLARMARLSESVTVCEMLGDSGGARSPEAARRYAEQHGWLFLEGRTITEAFLQWSG